MIIKICGITRIEDGLAAVEGGADWLGFIRWPRSSRYLPLDECVELIGGLRANARRDFDAVGVYVNASRDEIEMEAERLRLNRIQLHGDESLAFARSLGRPVVKALHIRDAASVRAADDYEGIDLLADAFDAALPGGTGICYDYAMLGDLIQRRRVIIAGGLNPDNVGNVVGELSPWGVDVSSGVESFPGIKDPLKLRAFIRAAREARRSQV